MARPIALSHAQFDSLLEIGAYIDIQGFYVDEKFCPRQLAVYREGYLPEIVEFSTGLRYKTLSFKDAQTANYLTNHVHGLSLDTEDPTAVPLEKLGDILRELSHTWLANNRMSHWLLNPPRKLFAHNNNHTEQVLTQEGFNSISLREIIPELPNSRAIQTLYSRSYRTLRHQSALTKVQSLSWYISKLRRNYIAHNEQPPAVAESTTGPVYDFTNSPAAFQQLLRSWGLRD